MTASNFSWEKYLKDTNAVAAPEHLFKEVNYFVCECRSYYRLSHMGLKAYECGLAYWYAIIAEDGRFI